MKSRIIGSFMAVMSLFIVAFATYEIYIDTKFFPKKIIGVIVPMAFFLWSIPTALNRLKIASGFGGASFLGALLYYTIISYAAIFSQSGIRLSDGRITHDVTDSIYFQS